MENDRGGRKGKREEAVVNNRQPPLYTYLVYHGIYLIGDIDQINQLDVFEKVVDAHCIRNEMGD